MVKKEVKLVLRKISGYLAELAVWLVLLKIRKHLAERAVDVVLSKPKRKLENGLAYDEKHPWLLSSKSVGLTRFCLGKKIGRFVAVQPNGEGGFT